MAILVTVFLMVVAAFVQAMLFAKKSFSHFEYRCNFDRPEAFEGDQVELVEEVYNRKALPLPWFKTEITTSKWLDFASSQSVITYNSRFVPSFFLMKSYQKVTRRWKVTCLKRGVFDIEKVVLVATDLLGQQTASRDAGVRARILVMPRPVNLEDTFVNARYLQGDQPVKNQLIPDPFYVSGVREYRPGDPMKNIHWNATAKLSKIMIRNMEYTTRQSITILLNLQSRPFEQGEAIDSEKIEQSFRVATALLEQTLEQSIPVSLAVNSNTENVDKITTETPQQFGREYILSLLRLLAAMPAGSTQDFLTYLRNLRDQHGSLSSTDITIVTCYLCEEMYQFARQCAAQDKRVTFFLVGYPTEPLPEDCEIFCLPERETAKDSKDEEVAG